MADITESPEWSALAEHHAALAGRPLSALSADDPERAGRMPATAGAPHPSYSQHCLLYTTDAADEADRLQHTHNTHNK
ncbi:hypothetical protein, partial [Actinomadura sp. BRA 177]|uniref:hypothetical protein n=1 Tax=Actinomadura sp. BRA 177 TaxID=2745202 RepID=UPI001595BA7C